MKYAPQTSLPPASLTRAPFLRFCLFRSGKYAVCLLPSGGAPAQYELRLVYHQQTTDQFLVMGGGRRPADVIDGNWSSVFRFDDPYSNAVFNELLRCPFTDTAKLSPADIQDLIGVGHGL